MLSLLLLLLLLLMLLMFGWYMRVVKATLGGLKG